jgi:8-oxo-dGTP pyrophosphatase MutT (NUDIX family)
MKKLVNLDRGISWLPVPGEGRLYITDELPARELCRTAFGFAFNGDKVLMTRLKNRDWDIPGGKIDPGETPQQTVVREVLEETFVQVEVIELIGIQEIELFGARPENFQWSYPLSIQVYFLCRISKLLPFRKNKESFERGFLDPDYAREIPTMRNHEEIYEEALRRISRV